MIATATARFMVKARSSAPAWLAIDKAPRHCRDAITPSNRSTGTTGDRSRKRSMKSGKLMLYEIGSAVDLTSALSRKGIASRVLRDARDAGSQDDGFSSCRQKTHRLEEARS